MGIVSTQENFIGKRLVVFGAGYVGGALVATALARGARVVALTRNLEKAAQLRALGASVVQADLASPSWHAELSTALGHQPADYAVNCVSSGGGGIAGYEQSYLRGMASVVDWARDGLRADGTLVYTSSTSVYAQDHGAIVTEQLPADSTAETAQVLLKTEATLRAAPRAARWFILRLAGIYGPDRHHLLDQLRAGETTLAGLGTHRLNLIHRDDIVSAILAALTAPREIRDRIFNVADDAPSLRADVATWLHHQLGGTAPLTFTGQPAGGRRAVTPDRSISNQLIRTVLDWRPTHADFRSGYGQILTQLR